MNTQLTKAWIRLGQLRSEERGEIGSNLVWAAGIILAAIAIVGILYTVFVDGANNISVDPGVG